MKYDRLQTYQESELEYKSSSDYKGQGLIITVINFITGRNIVI
jgi:hypothetical protein